MNDVVVVLFAAAVLAIPLTLLVCWIVLVLYQRALLRWMQREPAPRLASTIGTAITPAALADSSAPPSLPTLTRLKRLERSHWAAMAGLWLLIGVTAALLWLSVYFPPASLRRTLAMGVGLAAPGWIMLGLMARLPWRRGVVLAMVFGLGPFVLTAVLMESSTPTVDTAGGWLAAVLAPLPALVALIGIPSLRAIAPLLYVQVATPTALAYGGLIVLMRLHQAGASSVLRLPGLPPMVLLMLAAVLPVMAGVGVLHTLSRAIAAAHRRGWLNDHSFSLAAGALLVLLFAVLPGWNSTGPLGLLPLLAWLWVPLALALQGVRRRQQPVAPGTPLLVLRLFRRPGPVGWLFDQVVQRWRFVGPVLLITASDLAGRTLDADELVQFLDGRLGERFIAATDPLPPPVAAPDRDGRFRVQEFCCYDSSWQMVLEQLLQRSQVVLMDLRGFGPAHRGCLHELGRLGVSAHLQRVVLLADASTNRAIAAEAFAAGSAGLPAAQAPPLQWVEERRRRHPTMEAVLAALTLV
jgi:hypothetical protein